MNAEEGVGCLQQRLAYDLEPMALAAGQHGDAASVPMLTYRRKEEEVLAKNIIRCRSLVHN
ncbi:MAG TPA: hypothetical protein DEO65_09470 [Bacillus bacterium]|nr:hypothetical protein [Bacillus sp. (in: firmicutes)]